jgi:UDP-N-acetylmuramyl tripeptide synthase
VVASPERDGVPFTVLVDYAHTPGALAAALEDARRLAPPSARVLVAFGCGGGRDALKRPSMGAVAAERAEVVVVTSDNPRHEPPSAIVAEVLAGVPVSARAEVHADVDRRRAIGALLAAAAPGDVVVVAGKGHEDYQEVGDERLSFDDRAVVRELLALPDGPGGH